MRKQRKRIVVLLLGMAMAAALFAAGCAKSPVREAAGEVSSEADEEERGQGEETTDERQTEKDTETLTEGQTEKDTETSTAPLTKKATEQPTEKATETSMGQPTEKGSERVTVKEAQKSKGKGLRVKGTKLVDKKGNTVVLRGVSTHGLSWFPQYVNKEAFRQMRDEWNVNTIRLAMYTAEYQGYCTGDENNRSNLIQLIDKGVKACEELNMYVIIDWHILSDANPNNYKKEAVDFFSSMSKKYASKEHVIYEICNEPNGGTSWEEIKSYAKDVISSIRKNDKDAVIITGTPTWSQDVDIAADSPIDDSNILYALHFYADTHRDDLRNKLKEAQKKGLPVIVSEFGICDASGNGGINTAEADKWMALLKEYSIGYVIWNLSNKGETCALIRSSCNKTSGWTKNELSESGRWFINSK